MSKQRVGIWMYSNGGGDKIQKKIIKKLKKRDIEVIPNLNLRNAIVENGRIVCNDICMEELDLFFSYNAGQQTQYQMYLYEALDYFVPCINNFKSFAITEDKFKTAYILRQNGIRTADFKLCHRDDVDNLRDTFESWGKKMVYKPTDGWGGVGLVKIEDDSAFDMLMPFLNQTDIRYFYVERFINYDNSDYRVDIVDGEFISCYGRKAPKDNWKTNITSGGSIILREDVGKDDEVVQVALKAAKATGLEIAGVDLIYDLDAKEFVVLEVNGIPAFATPEQEKLGLNFNKKKINLIVDLIEKKIEERK